MLKRVSRTMATIAALSALVMASQAGAADKLQVKDASGNVKFDVTDTGAISLGTATPSVKLHIVDTPGTPTDNIETVYTTENPATPTLRYKLNKGGASAWYLKDNSNLEVGRIAYTTPQGFPGILFQTGAAANLNRFDLANFGTFFGLYFNAFGTANGGLAIANTTGNVGIGTTTPAQKLEVVGGIRLNTAAGTPACDSNARGTLWVTQGATDTVQICVQTGSGLAWKTITLQ